MSILLIIAAIWAVIASGLLARIAYLYYRFCRAFNRRRLQIKQSTTTKE